VLKNGNFKKDVLWLLINMLQVKSVSLSGAFLKFQQKHDKLIFSREWRELSLYIFISLIFGITISFSIAFFFFTQVGKR